MDKYEYKVKSDEIKSLITQGNYAQAAEIADTIDWRRVKSVMMLCTVSDLYKINRRYEDAKNMLLLAYERRPGGRTICYSLCELCIKTEEFVQAVNYYKEFVQAAPKDSGRYILQYKLYEAQDVSLEERIGVLEELKKRDYREKWAYELAYLYHRVGLATRCVEECDELILWFGEGRYVIKAMELKMLHQPLSQAQQEIYDRRFEEMPSEDMQQESGYQEGYENQEDYGQFPPEGQGEEYGWTSEEEQADAYGQEYPEADSIQEPSDELDIQVKPVDVGQYNTINLQAELAAGLQEVLGAEESAYSAEPAGKSDAAEAAQGSAGYQGYEEEEIEDSEVFFGATGEIEDMGLVTVVPEMADNPEDLGQDIVPELAETAEPKAAVPAGWRVEQGGAPESAGRKSALEEGFGPAGRQVEPGEGSEFAGRRAEQGEGSEFAGRRVEQREIAEPVGRGTGQIEGSEPAGRRVEQGESAEPVGRRAEQGESAEPVGRGMGQTEGSEPAGRGMEQGETAEPVGRQAEQGEVSGPVGQGRTQEGNLRPAGADGEAAASGEDAPPGAGEDATARQVMEQLRTENGEGGTAFAGSIQPPRELADVLSQEADGQISMVLPESAAIEKQITGQMKIEDILVEWEKIKKENEQKCKEEVRRHVLSQTGPMFTEFEAKVRDGLLEQLEKSEAGQSGTAQERAEAAKGRKGREHADPEAAEETWNAGAPGGMGAGTGLAAGAEGVVAAAGYLQGAAVGENLAADEAEESTGYADEIEYEGADGPGGSEFEDEVEYIEEAEDTAYENKADYAEETGYEDEADYAEEAGYEDGLEYIEGAEDVGYENEADYAEEAGYEEGLEYIEEAEDAAYENEAGYPEKAGYGDALEYELEYAEEAVNAEYEGEAGYTDETGYEEEAGYTEEAGYEETSVYDDDVEGIETDDRTGIEDGVEYADEAGYEEGFEYADEAGEEEAAGYTGETPYDDTEAEAAEGAEAEADTGYEKKAGYIAKRKAASEEELPDETSEAQIPADTADGAEDDIQEDDIVEEIEEIQEQVEEEEGKGQNSPKGARRESRRAKGRQTGNDKQAVEREQAKVRSLTREEKELFAPFVQSRRSKEQLVKALDGISMAAYTGNLIITGEEGMDTLTLAKNMMREIRMTDSNFSGKVAKVSGKGLNEKDVARTLEQLNNGALIIQNASGMSGQTAALLHRLLQQERFGIIIVLEDTKKAIKKLFLGTPDLYGDFTARIDLEALSNDTLVAFGRQYAREKEFSIDNLGVLALHTRIEEMQTIDHVVTVIEVKQIVDEAIRRASKKTFGHFIDVLLARRYDDEDMIILTEKDFVA